MALHHTAVTALLDAAVRTPDAQVREAIVAFLVAEVPDRAAALVKEGEHPLCEAVARELAHSGPVPDDLIPPDGDAPRADAEAGGTALAELVAELVLAPAPADAAGRDARRREVLRLLGQVAFDGPPEHLHDAHPWPELWTDTPPVIGEGFAGYPAPATPPPGPAAERTVTLHPRIDGPGAVVVETEFGVRIGVSRRRDRALLATGGFDLPADVPVELDLFVTYDPDSLEPVTAVPRALRVEPGSVEAYVEARFVAKDGELARERRIGVHYLRDGRVLGIAWKRFLAVLDERELASAEPPDPRERELLELDPLMGAERPDVVVAVYKADAASGEVFLWAACPTGTDVAVPDTGRSSAIGPEAKQFATDTRRLVGYDDDAHATYLTLLGRGRQIGWAVPEAIRSLFRRLASRPGDGPTASVLLLTEEAHIPWELAVFDPPAASAAGGDSPFLGSHLAIARWPLTEHRPRPVPRDAVQVRRSALLFGRYEGVKGWGRLPHAEEESEHIKATYPPAEVIEPRFATVVDALRGSPPAELLHVALHGQFDPDGTGTGLVLLKERDGTLVPQFLTPDQIVALQVPGTFVFLNACQVGAGREVLGNYAGLAVALLRAGAGAVLAPLWNVDDAVAAAVAREFYAAVFSDPPVSAGEALCRIRRPYTESAARGDGARAAEATRLAYQLFGHPRLRLTRSSAAEPVGARDA